MKRSKAFSLKKTVTFITALSVLSGTTAIPDVSAESDASYNMNVTINLAGEKKEIRGDVNKDGKFTVADLVMLEKWLLGSGEITDWQAGDLYKDNVLDVYDLCLMREEIIK